MASLARGEHFAADVSRARDSLAASSSCSTADPALTMPPERAVMRLMRLHAAAERLVAELGLEAECRLLKGLAVGPLDYPNGVVRQSSDVDLLIPRRFVEPVLNALAPTELVDGGVAIHDKSISVRSVDGVVFDLHFRINRFLPFHSDVWFDRPQQIPGSLCLALPADLRVIHAAVHYVASRNEFRNLSSIIDIVRILEGPHAPDAELVRETAEQAEVAGVVRVALEVAAAIMMADTRHLRSWPELSPLEERVFLRKPRRLYDQLLMITSLETRSAQLAFLRSKLSSSTSMPGR